MISYHLAKGYDGARFAAGFKVADTNDVERLKKAILGWAWSPCIWKDGRRLQENFLRADWCVLDVDSPEMPLADACSIFCDMTHLIGTTRSHQKEKGGVKCDRYRVLLKFDHPITDLRDYRFTMNRMVRRYPVDPQPKDGARFFFPCTEIIQASDDGYLEDCLEAPKEFERVHRAKLQGCKEAGTIPPYARWALATEVPIGARNNTWFRVGCSLGGIGMGLEDIVVMIVKSRTYAGQVTSKLVDEIEECVGNGIKAALREIKDDGR